MILPIRGLLRHLVLVLVVIVTSTGSGIGIGRSSSRSTSVLGVVAAHPHVDVVAIIPDRSTAYPNGVHNGLLLSAYEANITLEIQTVGNFDPEISYEVLQTAIDTPTANQPKIYAIWPVDGKSRTLIQTLYKTHQVPIIQINQLPGDDSQWEWEHLLGYAGPSDAVRAANAGTMMVDAMMERNIESPQIVALGYPITYGGYHLSIAAFQDAINDSSITLIESLPLDWGSQNAYNAMVSLLDTMVQDGTTLHGVYAMDDDILKGAYQAIIDRRGILRGKEEDDDTSISWLEDITLVGTVCNGARQLLQDSSQYGTTVQSPFLEAVLAMNSIEEYLRTGTIQEQIRFTPNPSVTGTTVESLIISFLDVNYVADDLCTWNLEYIRSNGLQDPTLPDDICVWVDCIFIPEGLIYAGYAMVGMNYILALLCGIGIILYRKTRVMTLAQPPFLALVIVGACIDTTSILFMSRDNRYSPAEEQLDRGCYVWPWLLTLGQMMTTATLVAKIYRVKAVTMASTNTSAGGIRRVVVRARDVSGFIIGGLVIDIIILLIWYITDPFHWQIQIVNQDTVGTILSARGECSSDGDYFWMYPFSLLLIQFALLIYANLLAYQTRAYHKISDSKMVAISLFNSIQLLLVAAVMLVLSGDNVAISYVVRASYAFLNNVGVLALIVVPKVYASIFMKDIYPGGRKTTIVSGLHQHPSQTAAGNNGGSGNGSGQQGNHHNGSGSGSGGGSGQNADARSMQADIGSMTLGSIREGSAESSGNGSGSGFMDLLPPAPSKDDRMNGIRIVGGLSSSNSSSSSSSVSGYSTTKALHMPATSWAEGFHMNSIVEEMDHEPDDDHAPPSDEEGQDHDKKSPLPPPEPPKSILRPSSISTKGTTPTTSMSGVEHAPPQRVTYGNTPLKSTVQSPAATNETQNTSMDDMGDDDSDSYDPDQGGPSFALPSSTTPPTTNTAASVSMTGEILHFQSEGSQG